MVLLPIYNGSVGEGGFVILTDSGVFVFLLNEYKKMKYSNTIPTLFILYHCALTIITLIEMIYRTIIFTMSKRKLQHKENWLPEMHIWSIMLIKFDLKMVYTS